MSARAIAPPPNAKLATRRWISTNLELRLGALLLNSELQQRYEQAMEAARVIPVNNADLGKLLRSELESSAVKIDLVNRGPRSVYLGIAWKIRPRTNNPPPSSPLGSPDVIVLPSLATQRPAVPPQYDATQLDGGPGTSNSG